MRGTEKFIFGLAVFLGNYFDVTILEPEYNNKITKPTVNKVDKEYSKIKWGIVKATKLKLPFNQYIFKFKNLPKDGIIYFPFDFYSQMPALLSKPKRQIYILGVAHGLHLQKGQLAHHPNIGKIALSIVKIVIALKGKNFRDTIYYHTHNDEQSKYLLKAGVSSDHIFKISNYTNTSEFYTSNNNSKMLRILHVGGINKNAEFIVKIIEKLIRQNMLKYYEFHFIGKEMPNNLEFYSKKNKNIIVHGFVEDEEKAKIMSKMDVLLLADVETFSVTMLDGLASGLSVISSDGNPVASELKRHKANIYIVKHESITGYINALEILSKLKRRNIINAQRNKNRKIILNEYSKETVLKKYLPIFKNIVYK